MSDNTESYAYATWKQISSLKATEATLRQELVTANDKIKFLEELAEKTQESDDKKILMLKQELAEAEREIKRLKAIITINGLMVTVAK